MTQDVTIDIYGTQLPARLITLEGSTPGVEIEGVTFPYVTDEVDHGIRATDDEQRRKLDELRQRLKITSQASVVPFDIVE